VNINGIIERVKKTVGAAPGGVLANLFDDTFYRESIIRVSLPEFNKYCGFTITSTMDKIVNQWWRTDVSMLHNGLPLEIKMPENITRQIKFYSSSIKQVLFEPIPINNLQLLSTGMRDDMRAIIGNEIMRTNKKPPHCMFRAPDVIVVENYTLGCFQLYCNYQLLIQCTHPVNLSTITHGISAMFEDLCRYDVMIQMWNNKLRMLKAEFGSISVDAASVLDNFANAEGNKKELIDKVISKAAVDTAEFIWI